MLSPIRIAKRFAHIKWHLWTPRKLVNLLRAERDFRTRRVQCRGLPYENCIEITNVCNAHCQLCPIGQGYRPRPTRGFMPIDTFTAIIDSIAWHTYSLGLYNWGEPLLHPKVFDMVRLAKARRVSVHISTNMHFLKDAFAAEVVDSGLDLLIVSVHAMSQASYEAYQPGERIDEPLSAVRNLVDYKCRTGSRSPEVQLHFVVHRKNEHEIPRLVEFCEDLGLTYALTPVSLNLRFLDRGKDMRRLGRPRDAIVRDIHALFDEWLPNDERFVNPYYARLRDDPARYFERPKSLSVCDWLWRRCIIAVDGDVMPCCGAYGQDERLGNVLQAPLPRIWNGPTYQAARRAYLYGEANDTVCSWCSGMLL